MKKHLFTLMIFLCSTVMYAQDFKSSFRVDAPANLQGYKNYSEAEMQYGWGGGVDSTWEGIPVAYDPANLDGCNPFPINYFNGKVALIMRGSCDFGVKALNAQDAGAVGVIFINNLNGLNGLGAGNFGALVTIPVLILSKNDGTAIKNEIDALNPVLVSLTGWKFDVTANNVDIGYKYNYSILPHAKCIPAHQVSTNLVNDMVFRFHGGGRIANYSISNWDSLAQKTILKYNPALVGGVFTDIDSNKKNQKIIPAVTALDSVLYSVIDSTGFNLNNKPIGRYRVESTMNVIPDTESALTSLNNGFNYTVTIHDSIYSKCEYDFVNNRPLCDGYLSNSGVTQFEWGPAFYVRNGGYKALKTQAVIMRDLITDSVFAGQDVYITLSKWDDLNLNNALEYGELTDVAYSNYTLTNADIIPLEGLTITANLMNAVNPGSPCILDGGQMYWMRIGLPAGIGSFAIGTDYSSYAEFLGNYNIAYGGYYMQGNPLFDITNLVMYPGGFTRMGSPSLALITGAAQCATAAQTNITICQGQTYNFFGINYGVTGTYPHTILNGNADGCDSTVTLNLTVQPLPNVTANANNNNLCPGDSVILTGLGAMNYNWTNGVMDGVPYFPNLTNTYIVTGSDANNCTATSSITVTVLPPAPINISVSANPVCMGDSVMLSGGPAMNINYSWTGGITDSVFFTPVNTNTYTVTATGANSCTSTQSITVTVNPLPVPLISQNGLQLSTGVYVNYQWNMGGNSIPGEINQTYTVTQNGAYSVTVEDANGCIGTSADIIVSNVAAANIDLNNMISLHPNPTHDFVYIKGIDPYRIQVLKADGTVIESHANTNKIDLTSYANGLYLIQLFDNNNSLMKTVKITKW